MDRRVADSRRQERQWADRWGGEVTPGSGNGDKFKADVRTAIHLIELKYTKAMQFTLKLGDLKRIEQQALLDGRDPVFGIEFTGFAGDNRYVVLPEWDYLAKLERLAEQDALIAEREAIIRASLPVVVPGPDGLIHGSHVERGY
jgi:hypothetical protein